MPPRARSHAFGRAQGGRRTKGLGRFRGLRCGPRKTTSSRPNGGAPTPGAEMEAGANKAQRRWPRYARRQADEDAASFPRRRQGAWSQPLERHSRAGPAAGAALRRAPRATWSRKAARRGGSSLAARNGEAMSSPPSHLLPAVSRSQRLSSSSAVSPMPKIRRRRRRRSCVIRRGRPCHWSSRQLRSPFSFRVPGGWLALLADQVVRGSQRGSAYDGEAAASRHLN